MGTIVLNGATSGSTTVQPTDAVTVTLTLPAATGTVMVSGNMPAFSAYFSGSQTVANGTFTKISFNTKYFDTATAYDAVTNYRFTAPVAGYYQVNMSCRIAMTGASESFIDLYKNGSEFLRGGDNIVTGTQAQPSLATVIYLAINDYIEAFIWQGSGISQAIQSGAQYNNFSAVMVRSA